MNVNSKTKKFGQVFTPEYIVKIMLDLCKYNGVTILGKHIVDNSCGDGAFLREVVKRYIEVAKVKEKSLSEIKRDLETYIHGIEVDKVAFDKCYKNLSNIATDYGISDVKWNIFNTNALLFSDFDEQMDYVVGNPPYVRVHNLDVDYDIVKSYDFAKCGMTNMYLAFFELGFKMLNDKGQLCYITPNSWLNSIAGKNIREYILQNKTLSTLIDFEHNQVFENATTYTIVSHFNKANKSDMFDYYVWNEQIKDKEFIETLSLNNMSINDKFYINRSCELNTLFKIKTTKSKQYVSVKNGFATLADSVFIGEQVPESKFTISVVKATTGKIHKCLYPYDDNGVPIAKEELFLDTNVKEYLNANKELLLKSKKDSDYWYLFGRTQALKDVFRKKLAINNLIRSKEDLKLTDATVGEGVYGGMYITTNGVIEGKVIEELIVTDDFVEYVKILKKYRSGDYYMFDTKDLEEYLNYKLSKNIC